MGPVCPPWSLLGSSASTPLAVAGSSCSSNCRSANGAARPTGSCAKLHRERSTKENRILMIKGIAFGIDDAGARNAQKGCW
jgi:hypothetical protein